MKKSLAGWVIRPLERSSKGCPVGLHRRAITGKGLATGDIAQKSQTGLSAAHISAGLIESGYNLPPPRKATISRAGTSECGGGGVDFKGPRRKLCKGIP